MSRKWMLDKYRSPVYAGDKVVTFCGGELIVAKIQRILEMPIFDLAEIGLDDTPFLGLRLGAEMVKVPE